MRRKLRWSLVALGLIGCGAVIVLDRLTRGNGDDAPAPPVCEVGPTTRGIDVSYYQDTIQWRRVKQAGMQFAFIRVSDGTALRDPKFTTNWLGAAKAGVMRGAYQYFRPEVPALAQADLLIAALAQDRGELPPVIDVETAGGKSASYIAQQVRTWVTRVRDKLGVEPIIYAGPEFWRDAVGGADLTTQPLWVAHYTTACPTVPPTWKAWTFWQHTDRGRVRGIAGAVDLNVFAGTFAELQDFARRSRVPRAAAR
ncbi:MAG: GH25 family lysozyme [Kofleriaceae bacterium]